MKEYLKIAWCIVIATSAFSIAHAASSAGSDRRNPHKLIELVQNKKITQNEMQLLFHNMLQKALIYKLMEDWPKNPQPLKDAVQKNWKLLLKMWENEASTKSIRYGNYQTTPLHHALMLVLEQNYNEDLIDALLTLPEILSFIDLADGNGDSSLCATVRQLREFRKSPSLYREEIEQKYKEIIQKLLAAGANADLCSEEPALSAEIENIKKEYAQVQKQLQNITHVSGGEQHIIDQYLQGYHSKTEKQDDEMWEAQRQTGIDAAEKKKEDKRGTKKNVPKNPLSLEE